MLHPNYAPAHKQQRQVKTSNDALRRSLKFKLKLILSENKILVQTIDEYVKKAEAVYRDTESLEKIPTKVFKKAMARLETAYSACIKMVLLASDLFEDDKNQTTSKFGADVSRSMSQGHAESSCADSLRSVDKETMRRLASLERKFHNYLSMRGQEFGGGGNGRKMPVNEAQESTHMTGNELYKRMMTGHDNAEMYVPADPVIELRRFLFGLDCTVDDGYRDPRIVLSNERKKFGYEGQDPILKMTKTNEKQSIPPDDIDKTYGRGANVDLEANVVVGTTEDESGAAGDGEVAERQAGTEAIAFRGFGKTTHAEGSMYIPPKTAKENQRQKQSMHREDERGTSQDVYEFWKMAIHNKEELLQDKDLLESLLKKVDQTSPKLEHQVVSPILYGILNQQLDFNDVDDQFESNTTITTAPMSPGRADKYVTNIGSSSAPNQGLISTNKGGYQTKPSFIRYDRSRGRSFSPPSRQLPNKEEILYDLSKDEMYHPSNASQTNAPNDIGHLNYSMFHPLSPRSKSGTRQRVNNQSSPPNHLVSDPIESHKKSPFNTFPNYSQAQSASGRNMDEGQPINNKPDRCVVSETETAVSNDNFHHILHRINDMERFVEQEISSERDLLTKCLGEFQKMMQSASITQDSNKPEQEKLTGVNTAPATQSSFDTEQMLPNKNIPVLKSAQRLDDPGGKTVTSKSPGVNFIPADETSESKLQKCKCTGSGKRNKQAKKPTNKYQNKCCCGNKSIKKQNDHLCSACGQCQLNASTSFQRSEMSKSSRMSNQKCCLSQSQAAQQQEELSYQTDVTETINETDNTTISKRIKKIHCGKGKKCHATDSDTYTKETERDVQILKNKDEYLKSQSSEKEEKNNSKKHSCSSNPLACAVGKHAKSSPDNKIDDNVDLAMQNLLEKMIDRFKSHILKAAEPDTLCDRISSADDKQPEQNGQSVKPKENELHTAIDNGLKEAITNVEDATPAVTTNQEAINLLDIDTSLHLDSQNPGTNRLLEPMRVQVPSNKTSQTSNTLPVQTQPETETQPPLPANGFWPATPTARPVMHLSPPQKPYRASQGLSGPILMTGINHINPQDGLVYQLPTSLPSQQMDVKLIYQSAGDPKPILTQDEYFLGHHRAPIQHHNQEVFRATGSNASKQSVTHAHPPQEQLHNQHQQTNSTTQKLPRFDLLSDSSKASLPVYHQPSAQNMSLQQGSNMQQNISNPQMLRFANNDQNIPITGCYQADGNRANTITGTHTNAPELVSSCKPNLQYTNGIERSASQCYRPRPVSTDLNSQSPFNSHRQQAQTLNLKHFNNKEQSQDRLSMLSSFQKEELLNDHTVNQRPEQTEIYSNQARRNYQISPTIVPVFESLPTSYVPLVLDSSPRGACPPTLYYVSNGMNAQIPQSYTNPELSSPSLSMPPQHITVQNNQPHPAMLNPLQPQNNPNPNTISRERYSSPRPTSTLHSSLIAPTRHPTATVSDHLDHTTQGFTRRPKSRSRSSLAQPRSQPDTHLTVAEEDHKKSSTTSEENKPRAKSIHTNRRGTSQTQGHNKSRTDKAENRTICIKNLPANLKEMNLLKVLNEHGYVSKIYFIKHRGTGELQGTAYVKFRQCHEAESAVKALTTLVFDGHTLSANLMSHKDER